MTFHLLFMGFNSLLSFNISVALLLFLIETVPRSQTTIWIMQT